MRAGFEYYRNWSENRQIYEECPRGEMSIPVLALGGTCASGDVPIETMQAVAEDVQGMTVKQAGHYFAEERPSFLSEQLLAFFEESVSSSVPTQ